MFEPQARALITAYLDGYDQDRGEDLWPEFELALRDLDLGDDGLFLALSVVAEFYTLMSVVALPTGRLPSDIWVEWALASQMDSDAAL